MKVYDLFPFFNELDLLELRLSELDPVVDVFGLVELPRTFTDLPKPLHYSESGRSDPKMRVYVPPSYPSGPHPTIDWFQRRQLSFALHDAEPDDIVMLSDVDEIPNRERVREYVESDVHMPVTLSMRLYYHRVDLFDPQPWAGTVICRRENLGIEPDMQRLREDRGNFPIIEDGGWHFSWMGNGEAIKEKLRSVDILRENAIYGGHGIQDPPSDASWLQECYEKGKDLFQRGRDRQRVSIVHGVNQPHEIASWLEKYPQYAAGDTVPY
jgi:beta-1,4-mannosyl-glycoprotein beta-1,4-N-acetylglucosaminyltransferase